MDHAWNASKFIYYCICHLHALLALYIFAVSVLSWVKQHLLLLSWRLIIINGNCCERYTCRHLRQPRRGPPHPLAEFAGRLVRDHHLAVTLIVHKIDPPLSIEQSLFDELPRGVNVVFFDQLPLQELPEGVKMVTRMVLSVIANLPRLRALLASIPSLAALVVDIFCVSAFDVSAALGIPSYIFFTGSCMFLSLSFHLRTIDASYKGEYRDMPEPVRLPGGVPLPGRDLPQPFEVRESENYKDVLRTFDRFLEAKGIFVNSFAEMEPGVYKALMEEKDHPPIYPVRPLVRSASRESSQDHDCLRWLDRQPDRSVVYVSFGSGGALTGAQMTELALGLELSGKRFLWVVKCPDESDPDATYFSVSSSEDPLQFLPEGFVERTRTRGLVIPFWAPQVAVLRHAATGGFLTHCGWNSTLESLVNAVPLIAWPLYAEQRMNAVLLTEDVKVALRPKEREEDGFIAKEEAARVIKCLMEGEEGEAVRKRAKELSEAAARAPVEGGYSFQAMAEVARIWKEYQTK